MLETLSKELKTFEKNKADLQKNHPGKFVLIVGDDVIGTYDTFNNAADEALRRYGDGEYMIRPVSGDCPELSPTVIYGLHRGCSSNDV